MTAFADEGPTLDASARAMGRAYRVASAPATRDHGRKRTPHGRRRRRITTSERGELSHGPEDPPVRVPARRHHRPEVQVVRRQGVRRLRRRGPSASGDTSRRRCGTPACRASTSSAPPTASRSTSTPRVPASSSAAAARRPSDPRRAGADDRQAGQARTSTSCKKPELDAQVTAHNVAEQLRGRVELPPRDAPADAERHEGRRQGHPRAVRRPPGRRRDEPHGVVPRGPRAAAHPAREHRLRLRRGAHHLRPHRRQGLDLHRRGPPAGESASSSSPARAPRAQEAPRPVPPSSAPAPRSSRPRAAAQRPPAAPAPATAT